MSLRNKMTIILLSIMAVSLLSYYGIFRTVIIRSFVDLDAEYARRDIDRCNAALDRELQQLNAFTHDWASWDDTCRFIDGSEQSYIAANLSKVTFQDQKLNLIHIYDSHGRLVWGKFYDLARDEELPLDLEADLGADVFRTMVRQENPSTSTSGVIVTRYGVMLISSNPVLTSQNEGPSRGAFVMGRLFTGDTLSMLSGDLLLKLDAWQAGAPDLPHGIPAVISSFTGRERILLMEASSDVMHAYSLIRDIGNRPALLLMASIPRGIMMKGAWTTRLGMAFTIAVGLFTLLIVSLMLHTLLLKPIASLKEKV
ncbi:MAG TPA: CHASE4 domain-containing protein, partial [Deltaproteobacteria bacterium]|nr:CHASE4 domain-containing protein [Deltaproteobacteria bacterium]